MSAFPRLDDDAARRCGPGTARACAYLALDGRGFLCGRADGAMTRIVNDRLRSAALEARRTPHLPWPMCQAQEVYDDPVRPID